MSTISTTPAAIQLATIYHLAGKPAATQGQSVSGVKKWLEFHLISPTAVEGRIMVAQAILDQYFVEYVSSGAQQDHEDRLNGDTIEKVARFLHRAEKTAILAGKIQNPPPAGVEIKFTEFDALDDKARAGRLSQAQQLLLLVTLNPKS